MLPRLTAISLPCGSNTSSLLPKKILNEKNRIDPIKVLNTKMVRLCLCRCDGFYRRVSINQADKYSLHLGTASVIWRGSRGSREISDKEKKIVFSKSPNA